MGEATKSASFKKSLNAENEHEIIREFGGLVQVKVYKITTLTILSCIVRVVISKYLEVGRGCYISAGGLARQEFSSLVGVQPHCPEGCTSQVAVR